MANPLYARLQVTAQRLIAKFGQTGTLTRITAPDPITGGDGAETAYPATLVPMNYDQRFINGTTITTADREIYISSVGLSIVPGPGDIVTAGGVEYTVISADPNNYDGITNVVFIVQGRMFQ